MKSKEEKEHEAMQASFDFFKTVKTGDKYADSGKKREIREWIDTGSYTFNALISGDMTKGFPCNRAVMLAGEQSVGKSFFAMYGFARPLVKKGYFIYYIDTENSVTDDDLIDSGLPEGTFKIISQSIVELLKTNFDGILTQIETAKGKALVNKNKCAFILDSQGMLGTLKSKNDIANKKFVNDMTLQKELKAFYRSILVRMGDLDIPMVITNHVYANTGIAYGDPTKIAGGSGGLYASTVILHMRKKQYKEGTIRKGTLIVAKCVKSRICRDGLEAPIYLNFEKGLNKWYGLHIFASDAGLIEPYKKETHDKLGIIGPEKAGNATYYVIKDPKKKPSEWIVCRDFELHKRSTIGTIFDEINEYVKEKFKLLHPIDFDYDEGEDIDIDESKLVDAETAASKTQKNNELELEN